MGIGAGMIMVWTRLRRERRAWFEEADRLSIRLIRAECTERTPVRAVVEREGRTRDGRERENVRLGEERRV
jgi:uncharacterized protein (DUF2236 family)